ncbi:hypothetical protein ZIOFF_052307 [Zingiber officinale]|uniref:non-specific serine/threonine protein kinase n=1 Tax=Zingiber officinale TaxID=94328 RepID=A0A8J5FLV2_ZINOF|nr:hypothetical protein ZIOFF_052307 [Zingiber officinale]
MKFNRWSSEHPGVSSPLTTTRSYPFGNPSFFLPELVTLPLLLCSSCKGPCPRSRFVVAAARSSADRCWRFLASGKLLWKFVDLRRGDMDKYELVRDLGSGNFGVARLLRNKETKELVAIKYIPRGLKVILTPTHLGIAMEYAAGGELFERICSAGRFSEDEARYFFQQLICGVSYCHFLQICHRDLKLENTLLDGSPAPRLKICDFGYSKAVVVAALAAQIHGRDARLHRSRGALASGVRRQGLDLGELWVIEFVMLKSGIPELCRLEYGLFPRVLRIKALSDFDQKSKSVRGQEYCMQVLCVCGFGSQQKLGGTEQVPLCCLMVPACGVVAGCRRQGIKCQLSKHLRAAGIVAHLSIFARSCWMEKLQEMGKLLQKSIACISRQEASGDGQMFLFRICLESTSFWLPQSIYTKFHMSSFFTHLSSSSMKDPSYVCGVPRKTLYLFHCHINVKLQPEATIP